MANTIQTYCVSTSAEIRRERDDMIDELMAWLTTKAAEGARPVPLAAALRTVAEFAAGYGPEAEAFWTKVRAERREAAP